MEKHKILNHIKHELATCPYGTKDATGSYLIIKYHRQLSGFTPEEIAEWIGRKPSYKTEVYKALSIGKMIAARGGI